MKRLCLLLLLSASLAAQTPEAPKPGPAATIAAKTATMQRMDGFMPLYWDAQAGKMYLEIPRFDTEFLYIDSLPAGVGSNDIGLDRGRMGDSRVVKFQRSGPRVLLVQSNYGFRASSPNPAERLSVEQAFAQSVLGGFTVAAEEGGRVLVDATEFFLQDVHDVIGALKRTKQGGYRLDSSRSAFYLPRTKAFPKNTEVEVTLTFTGDDPGRFLRDVAPNAKAITVRQHHSFVELPGPGFKPREFDPRAGYFGPEFMDFSAPIGQPIVRRFIARHRLQKKDPAAQKSEAVEPIIYYLDPGTPEPVRTALLEGARWWNQAFEAAGYSNAFRVEMLPEDADPMDARYNVIQWVHRATRGWSYGNAIIDPRTGEIIKGHVSLGSQRVRQDYMIAEGLLAPYEQGKPKDERMLQMALARLRQLSAHEVGHTLGLNHNYIASTAELASVMDYPHPRVQLAKDGSLSLENAYATGIGAWDKVAITWGYGEFPGDEKAALNNVIAQAIKNGLHFLTDQDARPTGSSHPTTHLWDNGGDAVQELRRILQVRERALTRFSENVVQPGQPLALMEDVLVPIYLLHRYQVEAAVKVLGGLGYTYAVRGDGQVPITPVPAAAQRQALQAVLETVSPKALALPEELLRKLPPRPNGYDRTRESFKGHTGVTFDPIAPAEAAANLSLGLLLDPERASRLVEQNSRNPQLPSLAEVIDTLFARTWRAPRATGYGAEVQRAVDHVALYHLMSLAASETALPQARAIAEAKLRELSAWARRAAPADASQAAHLAYAATLIRRFEDDPAKVLKPAAPVEAPPGAPIGSFACTD